MFPVAQVAAGNSIFGFRESITLVSYIPHEKNGRILVLLSTAYHDVEIDSRTNRPRIVEGYEVAKTVVDTMERTCAMHSVSRIRKWPLAVFFTLLDVAGMNAQILHNVLRRESPQKYRRVFLKNLALALLKPQLQVIIKWKRSISCQISAKEDLSVLYKILLYIKLN